MKRLYQEPVLDITRVCGDIVRTSLGGWQEGDNDITWGDTWSNKGE